MTRLPLQRIGDLLYTVAGTATRYKVEYEKPTRFDFRYVEGWDTPFVDYPLNPGGSLTITLPGPFGPVAINGQSVWIVDRGTLEIGAETFAEKYPRLYEYALGGDNDPLIADVYFQVCLFGDIVLGDINRT